MIVYMLVFIITWLGIIHEGTSYPPRGGDLTVEEYYIEHEVTGMQAKNATNYIELNTEKFPGCKACTDKEMRYCGGQQLVNDHCCCDKRYNEFFPYVPHTCYLGPTLCKPIAQDCAEYSRLRTCCCNKSVLEKWKGLSNTGQPQRITMLQLLMQLSLYFIVNHYL